MAVMVSLRRCCAMLIGVATMCSVSATAAAASCGVDFYPRVGSQSAWTGATRGPGLVLMGGGTDVDAAFVWIQRTIAGAGVHGGDLVVLRASGDNDYDAYIHGLAPYNSVRTLLLPTCASAADLTSAARVVDRSQAVFFAGGDQADYVPWKGTPLAAAVQHVYDRGGVVGGTSAGLAILGEYVFDSVAADTRHDVHTADAVPDPLEPAISFTHAMFAFPGLRDTITDTHFVARDRLGRLAVFIARLAAERPPSSRRVRAIGVDQRTALVVGPDDVGTLLLEGSGGRALFLSGGPAQRLAAGKPFVSSPIDAVLLDRAGEQFDLDRWCGDGKRYTIVVDGSRKPIYTPADPYVAPPNARPASCTQM